MSAVRVKICGLTSVDDALAACQAGADAIGLVFYPPSSRHLSLSQAALIANAIPPFVQRVALFVNPSVEQVRETLEQVDIDLLQFHGGEAADFCQQFDRPYIKAVAMKPDLDVEAYMQLYPEARGFLLDTYHPAKPGGTGEAFNWERFPQTARKPLILAGGLNPENISTAVNACRPYAVDVSGGVEAAPGKKSVERVQAFIQRAKSIEV